MVGRDGGFLITAASLTVFMAMYYEEDLQGGGNFYDILLYLSPDYLQPRGPSTLLQPRALTKANFHSSRWIHMMTLTNEII